MQCDVRSMAEKKANSETMPRSGKVLQVCREWAVHEDGALAYQLQHQEIKQHYSGNKTRNATVREDIPKAKTEQRKEEEEAAYIRAMYDKMLQEQEEMDSEVARRLAEKLEREEEERRQRTEQRDRKIASVMQAQEQRRRHSPDVAPAMSRLSMSDEAGPSGLHMSRRAMPLPAEDPRNPLTDLSDFCIKPNPDMTEEEARLFQEEQDAELARLMQEQEMKRRGDSLSIVDKDRLMAVEAQDHELAKMLHDKERAKLRRAKERARQKRLQKEEEEARAAGGEVSSGAVPRGTGKPRFPDPPQTVAQNIAVALDPTYYNRAAGAPAGVVPASEVDYVEELLDEALDELEEEEEEAAPPYMPIQGQKRTASLEKKKKRDQGCKQQ